MIALLQAVKRYLTEGLDIVPLRDGKTCVETNWPNRTFVESDFTHDVKGVGVKSTPRRRIIDNDYAPLGPACLRLLPATRVDGRPGKAPGHFEYAIASDELAPVQYKDVDNSVLIEILGTQAAMPPSPTREGPRYFIHDIPVAMSAGEILDPLVKLLATIGLVIKHWPSHGRHNLLRALVGFFARIGVPEDDALIALEEITRAAAGEIWKDCAPLVRDTSHKLDTGEAVTGGPKIAEALGDDVARRLRDWWIVDKRDRIVDELNATYFVATVGAEDSVGCDADGEVTFKTERSMRLRFANQKIKLTKGKKEVFETKYEIWKQHTSRREYRKVIFAPPPYHSDLRDFNLWRGYGVRSLRPATDDPASRAYALPDRAERVPILRDWANRVARPRCGLFLELTHDVICANHDAYFHFLIDHLAQTVQFPGRPGGIAVVMKGKRGIGKGLCATYFGGLFGYHFATVSKREQILGRFNAAIADKIVVFADECFYAADKASLGALKTLITDPVLQIEKKFIDSIQTPNFCHLFEATNEDWHTPAGFEERRFLAVACSDVWKRLHPERFDALVEEMNGGGREALLAYLLMRELTPERLRELRHPPRTAELDLQVTLTMSPEEQWWLGRLRDGRISELSLGDKEPWPNRVTTENLHADYLHYCDALKIHCRRVDKDNFKRVVLDNVLSASDREPSGTRRRTWRLAPLAECRRQFDQKKGISTAWEPMPAEPIVVGRPEQPSLEVPAHILEAVPFGDE